MRVDEELVIEDLEYYKIICLLSKKIDTGKWLARVRVIRKDTGEYINNGFTVFNHKKEVVQETVVKRVKEELLSKLEEMGMPPDWNTQVRHILVFSKHIHNEIMSFGECVVENFVSEEEKNERSAKYAAFWKMLIKKTILLSKKIELLNSDERIQLLIIPDCLIIDPSDTWCLEEIDLHIMIIDFFLNPSDHELKLHESQKIKLANRFKELGWN